MLRHGDPWNPVQFIRLLSTSLLIVCSVPGVVAVSFFRVCQSFPCSHLDSPAGRLSLDLCRVRLQLSCHVQRVRLASFLLLNNRLSGVIYFAFSSEGEKQPRENPTHSWGGLRGDGHSVLTCALPVSILHVDQFSTSCFPRTPHSVGRAGPLGKAHCSPHGP